MDARGQVYFDDADKVPAEDVERLRSEFERLREQNAVALERLGRGPGDPRDADDACNCSRRFGGHASSCPQAYL